MNKTDFFSAVCFFLFSLFFLWETSKIQVPKMFVSLSSRLWPEAILVLLCFCSILLLIQSLREKDNKKESLSTDHFEGYGPASSIAMIACFISSLALWAFGFFVTVPLFLLIFMIILGVRNIKTLIIIPLLLTTIFGFLFTRIAYIPFPKGFGIFYKINVIFY